MSQICNPPTCLLQVHLEQARDIHVKRHVDGKTCPRLDTAISRWLKSKRFMEPLSDKLIELRIALEALYLEDESGENGIPSCNLWCMALGL